MKQTIKKIVLILAALFLAAGAGYAVDQFNLSQKKSPSEGNSSQTMSQGLKRTGQLVPGQNPTTGEINGHEWVDLGLPSGVKWATCNLGASKPEMRGDYFAWGDSNVKSKYTSGNCPTNGKSFSWLRSQGYLDSNGDLSKPFDAAFKNWGGSWRIPTFAEIKELLDCTNYEWTTMNGMEGCLLTSKKNGATLFLPASGWFRNDTCKDFGANGGYWASTVCGDDDDKAYIIGFNPQGIAWYTRGRDYGRSIRPVSN